MKRMILAIGMVGIILSYMALGETHVQAAYENNPPQSIKLDNIFTTPAGSDSTVVQNGTTKKSYVQVTPDEGKNKNGAIWSTANNTLDLTKDFESSMYVYFGGMGENAADGMAFVMQNDARQGNTIIKGSGAQMGVWASDVHYGPFDGIQNSFAVEFDSHYNDGFDWNVGKSIGDHLAWGFPGQKSTYKDEGEGNRILNHNAVQSIQQMSNDRWYSFNVKWNATTKVLQYSYGDIKDKAGDKEEGPVVLPVVSVKIDPQTIFGGTNVVWGFTGSTGSSTENNQVAFAKVPGLVNEEGTETVTNSSGDVVAGKDVTGKKVSLGDNLHYKVGSKYTSGKQDWENILADFKLDGDVTYKPGTLKVVKKAQDGTEKTTLLPDSSWSNKALSKVNLGKLGTYTADANSSAYITFDVTADKVGMVNQSEAALNGDNYLTKTNALSYEISQNKAPTLTLADAGKSVDVTEGDAYKFNGTWKDVDSDTANLSYSVDGGSAVSFASDVKNDPKGQDHNYSATVPATSLPLGTHKVSVYAVDSDGAKSNVETVTINVATAGLLQFVNIPTTTSYGSIEIPAGKESVDISRGNDWDVRVKDTRKTGSHWHVDLTLTEPFTTGKGTANEHVLKEALVYKTGTSQTEFTVGTAVKVYDKTTVNGDDVPIKWADNQGVLMVAHSADYKGAYAAKLNWALVDAP